MARVIARPSNISAIIGSVNGQVWMNARPSNISAIIGSVNGQVWMNRRSFVRTVVTPQIFALLREQQSDESLKGQGVYASSDIKADGQNTNYDIVNAWQVNYVRGVCNADGTLLSINEDCWSDDAMFQSFYSNRSHTAVLDVGCNTGKNMMRAIKYAGSGLEVFGIEFSQDSVAVAQDVFGKDRAFQGDASENFGSQQGWIGRYSAVQCTAVLQHMTPTQVDAAIRNMSQCLRPAGELLLTFKVPTERMLTSFGMQSWIDDVVTADLIDIQAYLADGFLRAVMWDDDYYQGVTSNTPPKERDTSMEGMHRREFVFYSLAWMKNIAFKHGLFATHIEAMPDSKIPFGVFHWMVILLAK